VLVVAYNAESHLAKTLDRIPKDFIPHLTEVLVCDDASPDNTYLVGLGYQNRGTDLPMRLVTHPVNLGYGGNQKAGYRWAIEEKLDIVVLLHGDGQYAPEFLPQIVQPIVDGDADAVFGSRMLERGAALKGGMPKYKYLGNRVLSTFQNAVAGAHLSEWHSGYRAYSVEWLKSVPYHKNSDGFDFDTEIIVQLIESGARIVELPIPTYYGDEICHVNGMKYAWDVTKLTSRYRAHKMGFGTGELAFSDTPYELKNDLNSSHGRLLAWLSNRPAGRILDLGCADGSLAHRMRALGHEVTGVDLTTADGVEGRVDRFVEANLEQGIPAAVGTGFDIIVCADVLEHVRKPQHLLEEAKLLLNAGGSILASVPNFGHWYPRLRSALGLFDYDRRGILDTTHVRFFTRRSFERLVATAGLSILRRDVTGLPLDVADRGSSEGTVAGKLAMIGTVDHLAAKLRPQLFGYQFLYELKPTAM
jgi:2-polyprenyl-3-methyl-5-hydroxy-6-metoxy-1,4-benzoquinol methylase